MNIVLNLTSNLFPFSENIFNRFWRHTEERERERYLRKKRLRRDLKILHSILSLISISPGWILWDVWRVGGQLEGEPKEREKTALYSLFESSVLHWTAFLFKALWTMCFWKTTGDKTKSKEEKGRDDYWALSLKMSEKPFEFSI